MRIGGGLLLASCCSLVLAEAPAPSTMQETVETRLVQIDVDVEGEPATIEGLSAKDFILYVGNREISDLTVDRMCGPARGAARTGSTESETPAPPARPRASLVFYFDQTHLTLAGRDRALDLARDLIDRLVVGGARAALVSEADQVRTFVPLTEDRAKLLAGLDAIRKDPRQWSSYTQSEDVRASLVGALVRNGALEAACGLAKTYAAEERDLVRRTTVRLGAVATSLGDEPPPKAVMYFADGLRQKAGLHYLLIAQAAETCRREIGSGSMIPSAASEFDTLIEQAASRGVHVFTIEAQGLVATSNPDEARRTRDAEDAIVGLAAETGGEAFLRNTPLHRIVSRIEARTCGFLLSFPPGDLPHDEPLPVRLEVDAPKVKVRAQGRIVIPSASALLTSRLLSAFTDPSANDDGALRILLVPRGGDGESWSADVQIRARPSGHGEFAVDIGASIVSHDRVVDEVSTSIGATGRDRPLVLQKGLTIPNGPFSVVGVAHDLKSDDVLSRRLNAEWPDPHGAEPSIAPIAVLQQRSAALSAEGVPRSSGLLAFDPDEDLSPSGSIVLRSVVCRGTTSADSLVVERQLEGSVRSDFAPLTLEPGAAACVETVDAIPPGTLPPGPIDYRILVRSGSTIVAQERRTLRVEPPQSR